MEEFKSAPKQEKKKHLTIQIVLVSYLVLKMGFLQIPIKYIEV